MKELSNQELIQVSGGSLLGIYFTTAYHILRNSFSEVEEDVLIDPS